MKNKILKYSLIIGLPAVVIGLTLFIVISTILGWYTNVKQTGHLDANTKNVGFSYTINGEELEVDEYDITNLTFFDIDSMFEGEYFIDMCFEMQLNIKNITDSPLNYSIKFEGERQVTTGVANSYAACIMSTDPLGYVRTTDTEIKANKKYYTYDAETHKYTQATVTVGNTIPEDMDLYIFKSNFIRSSYAITSDTSFQQNKIYYSKVGTVYIPNCTRGSNIERYKKLTEIENVYEKTYVKVSQDATYDSSLTYYTYVESTNGNYYVPAKQDDVKEENFKNYFVEGEGYVITTDTAFQNERYYYLDEGNPVEINKLIPGTNTNIAQYYEKGSKIESLFVDSPEIAYTQNKGTANQFIAQYSGGSLAKKNDNQTLYIYVFGVQEIDTAKNEDFIFNTHNFKITIESSSESSWDVTDITKAPENNNEEPENNNEEQNGD